MVKKLTFWSNCWIVLKFRLSCRVCFSLRKNNLQAKIKVKMDEISQNYLNPNKIFNVFFRQTSIFFFCFFYLTSCNKLYQLGKKLEKSSLTILKNEVLDNFNQKGSTISTLDWKLWTFQEKTSKIFQIFITFLPSVISQWP